MSYTKKVGLMKRDHGQTLPDICEKYTPITIILPLFSLQCNHFKLLHKINCSDSRQIFYRSSSNQKTLLREAVMALLPLHARGNSVISCLIARELWRALQSTHCQLILVKLLTKGLITNNLCYMRNLEREHNYFLGVQ